MLCNSIINKHIVNKNLVTLHSILLLTTIFTVNCNASNKYISKYLYNDNNKTLSFDDKLNNKDVINNNLQNLKNNYYEQSTVNIKIQFPNNNQVKKQENKELQNYINILSNNKTTNKNIESLENNKVYYNNNLINSGRIAIKKHSDHSVSQITNLNCTPIQKTSDQTVMQKITKNIEDTNEFGLRSKSDKFRSLSDKNLDTEQYNNILEKNTNNINNNQSPINNTIFKTNKHNKLHSHVLNISNNKTLEITNNNKLDSNIFDTKDHNNKSIIDYILKHLWNIYNISKIPQDGNNLHVISTNNINIQQYIDNITNENNKLLDKRKRFKEQKIIDTTKNEEIINKIKNISNNKKKKTYLHEFLKVETSNFYNNIKYILKLTNQHEIINNKRAIIDTYLKMQSILSDNNINIPIINSFNKDISNKLGPPSDTNSLDIFHKKVNENINSFYYTCLLGNDVHIETVNEKLDIINNELLKLPNNPNNSSNILEVINKKLLELGNSSNIKDVINELNELIKTMSKLINNIKLQNIKSNLLKLNNKIYKLVSNINFHNIKNNLNTENKSQINNKLIIPTTNNILFWCSENYEDWAEELSDYEDKIISAFKYKVNKGQLEKQEFDNTFHLLNKVAVINLRIENYYRTAKLLCNLSPIKQPCPIKIKLLHSC